MPKKEKDKKRARSVILQTRVSPDQGVFYRAQAAARGVSVSALIRYAILDETPLRASPAVTLDKELGARLLASIGGLKAALLMAAQHAEPKACQEEIEAACRDLSEMRNLWFEAHGREP